MTALLEQPAEGQIFHIRNHGVEGSRFEWHPGKKTVYRVTVAPEGTHEVGEPVALNIETHGDAINAVLIFSRGYRAGCLRTNKGVIQ